uniref:Disease resistance RPP13-like protein 1 n=1 Tax=Elaeis guineensis var. tenera TaxID=51953 RepID=A0A8N4IHL2_ELAGV|nr:putative disease resistance RPP13-like protein 1 [Elaeis guineensis]
MQAVHPYHPDYLSPEQSWSLFRHYAFGGRDVEEQSHLEGIGKQIVNKCSGLPLAVKTIGSLLGYETDEDGWMEVLQSDLWELDKNNEILASLRLSYIRMPAHLKSCFLYCSMFPKDHVFDKDVLVRLWMAQGYIPPRGRKKMEDIGDECFNDLLRRSFFDRHFGRLKMHDMIHDLAKFIAGNECYVVVDKELPGSPDKVRHLYVDYAVESMKLLRSCNLRALRTLLLCDQIGIQDIIQFPPLLRCLRFCWQRRDETPDLLRNVKHLRYLQIDSSCIVRLPESVCLLYHLQILILYCGHLVKLPDGLGNLINLRYFELHSHAIERLPESVCRLRNLQTLDLCLCRELKELPSGMGNLTNLCHLDTTGAQILCLPAGIEKLRNLQRLSGRYRVQGGGIGVLKDLAKLQGDLFISALRNLVSIEDAKDVGLKYKHKLELEQLHLFWDADCENDWHCLGDNIRLHLKAFLKENKDVPADEEREEALLEYLQPPANLKTLLIEGYGGSKFPQWVGNSLSFASLRQIHIIGCQNVRSLPLYIHDSLGKLDASTSKSMLEMVHISGCPKLTSIGGLHNLHSLYGLNISVCPQLLVLSEEGLPSKLQYLHIEECQRLTSFPGMQNLTSLKELSIINCPQLRLSSEEGLLPELQYLCIEECQQLTSLWGMPLTHLTMKDCPKLRIMVEDQLSSIQIASSNKLISNIWWNINRRVDDLTSTDHVLEELTIWRCTYIPPPEDLPNFTSLRSLVVKDCPRIKFLPCKLLPSTLKSFVVDGCEDLMYLKLAQQNRDALEELRLVNCPKLKWVPGLKSLFFPKILRIEQCPQLPQFLIEETENRGTIDD